ncbi:MAG: DUF1269 domain-containing protein [Caldilineaceae bacterium]|nr:DUF1269 domain-containing protein [Caldilineaceae bacterium]
MVTLTVLKFATPDGAEQGLESVMDLQAQQLITLHDAAIVTWPEGEERPKTRQLVEMTWVGALDGAFWGMLFGLLFFSPLLGAAIGATMGALNGLLVDVGIDDSFVEQVRDKITTGTSALFLMTSDAVEDKVLESAKQLPKFEIIATNLPNAEEDKLRAVFSA